MKVQYVMVRLDRGEKVEGDDGGRGSHQFTKQIVKDMRLTNDTWGGRMLIQFQIVDTIHKIFTKIRS